jgi:hypothetical protein
MTNKREKRLRDYKSQSAAAKSNWGMSPERAKMKKKQDRKKLRLANKQIDENL